MRASAVEPRALTAPRKVISVSMSNQSNDTPKQPVPLLSGLPADARSGGLWCAAGVLGFSLTLPATRAAVPELGALFVAAGRSALAGLAALVLLTLWRERFPAKYAVRLAFVAACIVFGFPLTSALALRSVPAVHATIVIGLVPIVTAVYAVLRSGERPSREFWAASLTGAVGVVLFGESRGGLELAGADGWLFAAVALAALGYSEGARLARELGGFRVISWALVLSLPISVPLTCFGWPDRPLASVSAPALAGLLYVSFISMYLGMIAWYRGLARGSVASASQIQLAQPVLSLGWAWLLLDEKLSVRTLACACLVLACAVAARRGRVGGQKPDPARLPEDLFTSRRSSRTLHRQGRAEPVPGTAPLEACSISQTDARLARARPAPR